MKEIFLVILFNINGELTIIDGFYPLQVSQMQECEQRKEFAEGYLPLLEDIPEVAAIICGDKDDIEHQITIMNSTPL